MEPPLGQISFFLLCMQYARAQLENLGAKPYTAAYKARRAARLCKVTKFSYFLQMESIYWVLILFLVCESSLFINFYFFLVCFRLIPPMTNVSWPHSLKATAFLLIQSKFLLVGWNLFCKYQGTPRSRLDPCLSYSFQPIGILSFRCLIRAIYCRSFSLPSDYDDHSPLYVVRLRMFSRRSLHGTYLRSLSKMPDCLIIRI